MADQWKMCLGLLFLLLRCGSRAVEGHATSGQLYSSLTHMNDLFVFDNMVGQDLLPFLPSSPEVQRYRESYFCLVQDTIAIGKGDFLSAAITGNPLHLFSVMKRLVLYWPSIRQYIQDSTQNSNSCNDSSPKCEWWAKLSECEKNPNFMMVHCQLSCGLCGKPELGLKLPRLIELENHTVLPSANDLRGTSLALSRLQQVYRLHIPYLAVGKIGDVSTCVRLSAYDCIRIANESHKEEEYANAWQWYSHAVAIAEDPDLKAHINSLRDILAIEHDSSFQDNNPKFLPRRLSAYNIQNSWDTQYFKLCRGESLMDEKTLSSLKCYISSRGSPYLTLQPVKYEQLHVDPEMYMFYDIISDNEIRVVQDTAKSLLARSLLVSETNPKEHRVSQTAWIYNSSHSYLPAIAKRISAITGLHVFEGPQNDMAGEALQVLSYGIGGHYLSHMDPLWKFEEVEKWETYKDQFDHYDSGDRLATWMFYLSDVQAGGRTAFPNAGVSASPVKGAAVFWYNLKKNGRGNPQSLHGGCPVLLGHKWAMNKWIRENKNFLRYPCSLNIQE